jgi:large subunit ribosomal protein L18
MVDAGVVIPHGKEILPSEDRLNGAHIGEDVAKLVQEVKNRLEAA